MSGVLHEHGNNAKALVYKEKSDACFLASKTLEKVLMPSVKNIRLYLLLFSIELRLKGMLLVDGVSIKDLKDKKKFGHNLVELYNNCLDKKLIESDESVKSLFQKYNEDYGNELRYYVGLEDVFGLSICNESFAVLETFYLKNSPRN